MKIFGTDYDKLVRDQRGVDDELSDLYFRTDNALMNSGKSLYPLAHLGQLYFMPHLTVRIDRVGKGIAPAFAPRYYHEAAWSFSLFSPSYFDHRRQIGLDPMLAYSFDGAFVVGDLRPFDEMRSDSAQVYVHQSECAPTTQPAVQVFPTPEAIAEYISRLSCHFLLKMGDLISFPLWQEYRAVPYGAHLMLSEGDDECLYLHVR